MFSSDMSGAGSLALDAAPVTFAAKPLAYDFSVRPPPPLVTNTCGMLAAASRCSAE